MKKILLILLALTFVTTSFCHKEKKAALRRTPPWLPQFEGDTYHPEKKPHGKMHKHHRHGHKHKWRKHHDRKKKHNDDTEKRRRYNKRHEEETI